jgi:hypothetical protein
MSMAISSFSYADKPKLLRAIAQTSQGPLCLAGELYVYCLEFTYHLWENKRRKKVNA